MNNLTIYDGPGQLVNQRSGLPIQIERAIIFDWLPIIASDGLAIYSYYVALADNGAAFPGLRRTAKHIGMSKDRVQLHNKLLAWAGLLRIESGYSHDGANASNRYIIDNVPPCDLATLQYIAARASADPIMSTRPAFLRRQSPRRPPGLLDRIDAWRPANQRPIWQPANGNGMAHNATIPNDDRLIAIGLNPQRVKQLANLIPAHAAEGFLFRCINYIEAARQLPQDDRRYVHNPEAYLRALVTAGEEPAITISAPVPTEDDPQPEPPGMRSI